VNHHERSCVFDGMCRCGDCLGHRNVKQKEWPFERSLRCADKSSEDHGLRTAPETWRRCAAFRPKRKLVTAYKEAREQWP